MLPLLFALTAMPQEPAISPRGHIWQDVEDTIQPVKISHLVDEIRDGDRLVERYNYIVYEFEDKGGYVWARAYLTEANTVSFYGPFADRSRTVAVDAPQLKDRVISYFKRRFHRIDRFNDDPKAPAYETIWRWSPNGS